MITLFTQRKLERIGRRVRLDRDFEAVMRKKLEMAGALTPSRHILPPHWKAIGASLGTALCLLTGTASYAYTSDNVLPQHALYPVRLAVENVETRIATTPQQKSLVALKHLRRRIAEAAKLQALDRPLPALHREALDEAGTLMTSVQDNANASDDEKLASEAVQVESRELSEMIDQKEFADTDQERDEMRQQILEQATHLEQHIDGLANRRGDEQPKSIETELQNDTPDSAND